MPFAVISLEGGSNFRDLGGYVARDGRQTRQGLLYRAGRLTQLTPHDQTQLHGLGIKAIFDLREEDEYKEEGHDRVWEGAQVFLHPTTLGRRDIIAKLTADPLSFRMADFYEASLAPRAEYHARLFGDVLGQIESHATVFHCSAGKDRTGIFAALLLRLVGVPDEDIIADYHATESLLGDYEASQAQRFRGYGLPDAAVQELLGAAPHNMTHLLHTLDTQFGSAEGYLQHGGATSAQLDRFRDLFLA